MKKIVLTLSLLIASVSFVNASNVSINTIFKTNQYSKQIVNQNFDVNSSEVLYFNASKLLITKRNLKNENYVDDMFLCMYLASGWVHDNGFDINTHDGRLVYWSYYHGCMRHIR